MEQLLSYLLTEDGIHDLKEGLIVHDCDIKVDREQPLAIKASKIKHIVHLLNMGNFSHQAKCTIVDLVPDSLGTKLLRSLLLKNGSRLKCLKISLVCYCYNIVWTLCCSNSKHLAMCYCYKTL